MDEEQEARLVERAQSGDAGAFATLVQAYWDPLARYLLRLTGDREVARDLAQETFVHAYCAIRSTRSGLQARPWLYRIATNLAYNHLKRRRRFGWLPLAAFDPWLGTELSAVDVGDAVQRALARLRPDERAVLLLCGSEGLSYAEAGTMLGKSAEAVRKQFSRAAASFRRIYAEVSAQ